MEFGNVMDRLRSLADPEAVKGMARFGISPKNTLGVSMPALRKLGREIGRDHLLAEKLWKSGVHEARILAGLVYDWKQVTGEQMDRWVANFDSWDVCDQVCGSLFNRTPMAYAKAFEWSEREEEFIRRAGFVLMATLSVHDKKAPDRSFLKFFPVLMRHAGDGRNFVRKAVNWALRQIGKRNWALNRAAIETARRMQLLDSKSARWIASNALRELEGTAVRERLIRMRSRIPFPAKV